MCILCKVCTGRVEVSFRSGAPDFLETARGHAVSVPEGRNVYRRAEQIVQSPSGAKCAGPASRPLSTHAQRQSISPRWGLYQFPNTRYYKHRVPTGLKPLAKPLPDVAV